MVRTVKTVLVTGAGGMLGRAVCAALRREASKPNGLLSGVQIVGWGRTPIPTSSVVAPDLVQRIGLADLNMYTAVDVSDAAAVRRMLRSIKPDVVFHTAGLNAFSPADELERVNVGGLAKMFAGLEHLGRVVRVVVVGSASELGTVGCARSPIPETAPCEPETPYGKTKHQATHMALALPPASCIDAVIARPFNLVGEGMDERLALAAFTKQIAAVLRGDSNVIRCGPLHTRRDYLDVLDAAEALLHIGFMGRHGEIYNVCSGVGRSMAELLETLLSLSQVDARIEGNDAIPAGPLDVVGDPSKLMRETGWQRMISMETTLARLLASAGVPVRRPLRQTA